MKKDFTAKCRSAYNDSSTSKIFYRCDAVLSKIDWRTLHMVTRILSINKDVDTFNIQRAVWAKHGALLVI
jgi:hypothetical protein